MGPAEMRGDGAVPAPTPVTLKGSVTHCGERGAWGMERNAQSHSVVRIQEGQGRARQNPTKKEKKTRKK